MVPLGSEDLVRLKFSQAALMQLVVRGCVLSSSQGSRAEIDNYYYGDRH
ncbi:MAG: hypothetical protein HY785_13290 [Oscillatoriophycideae cyanobacterium NC_groundwater_1537_Pr4_S-0.65um_50_18]|nr:hypothetical protein [Oscillatoriophycideae cyanobacterium NC_groundwater_1537_Pr4_S-0.65um_50_18]